MGKEKLSDDFYLISGASNNLQDRENYLKACTAYNTSSVFAALNGSQISSLAEFWQNKISGKKLLNLQKLSDVATLLVALGINETNMLDSLKLSPTNSLANELRNLLKAQLPESQWHTTITEIQNQLRTKQRNALVSWLIANPDWAQGAEIEDANDVYGQLLIDVEMSPCMETSRIKQATASVQLFIQRCMMGLEGDDLRIDSDEDRKQWEWLKNYRVWEAAYKVLHYPENWLEPEFRFDKTPFFEEAEEELLQNAITEDHVETVYKNYLEKLSEVGRLEICGFYQEGDEELSTWEDIPGDGSTNQECQTPFDHIPLNNYRLYVFGRTKSLPHLYFYRTREPNGEWIHWEKIELDIEGDHLIPVMHNGVLHLFWPMFVEKQDEFEFNKKKERRTYYEIRFNYSKYKNGKWLPKQITSNYVNAGKYAGHAIRGIGEKVGDENKNMALDEGEIFNNSANFRYDYAIASLEIKDFVFWARGTEDDGSLVIRVRRNFGSEWADKVYGYNQFAFEDQFRMIGCDGGFKIELPDAPPITKCKEVERWTHARPFYTQQIYQKSIEGMDQNTWDHRRLYLKNEPQKLTNRTEKDHSIFKKINSPYTLNYPQQFRHHLSNQPFFFEDDDNTYFLYRPIQFCCEKRNVIPTPGGTAYSFNVLSNIRKKQYQVQDFYAPYVCMFQNIVNNKGVWGLLAPQQSDPEYPKLINQSYSQHNYVVEHDPNPVTTIRSNRRPKSIEFSVGSAYGIYHWELFFHLPMLVADKLLDQGKFEQSLKWLHAIFNPSKPQAMNDNDDQPMTVYWRIKPFVEEVKEGMSARLQDYVNPDITDPDYLERREELTKQSSAWKKDPFNPHGIAKYRPHAYMMNVVFKYLDVLIAWGDNLFRRDTMESVAEATQIYVVAAELLGKKPQEAPEKDKNPLSYSDLTTGGDGELLDTYISLGIGCHEMSAAYDTTLPFDLEYFCVPANPKLLEYWETVADRLFKLRNCMDIDGNVRKLTLFEPPIDPAALIKARAAGLSLSDALSDLYAPLPHYRFTYMLAKANEFCNDVKSLGGSLLSAIEKGDNEELSQIRSVQEINVLKATRNIRKMSIEEAKKNLDGLFLSKKLAEFRQKEYSAREYINSKEKTAMELTQEIPYIRSKFEHILQTAKFISQIPDIHTGQNNFAKLTGGEKLLLAGQMLADQVKSREAVLSFKASMAGTLGGYDRRKEDWDFQADLAEQEIKQIEEQIAAAEIRLKMAEKELENHDRQIENAQEIYTFAKEKFSSEALYRWMSRRLTTIYRQTYGLAHDLAKQAQRAANFELGLADDISVIQADNWDSAKQGLLSGENLGLQLRQLESRYMQENKREMEISKTISLRLLDGNALMELITNGSCEFEIPEALFDLDIAGMYFRRIKNIALSIPCVTGPYVSVNAKLSLLKHSLRVIPKTDTQDSKALRTQHGFFSSVITSNAQNDAGLFEPNLRDERYLPFEGAGAVGTRWRLELPGHKTVTNANNKPEEINVGRQFDYSTISDVLLHMQYTGRMGDNTFQDNAESNLNVILKAIGDSLKSEDGAQFLFSMKRDFPDQWHQLNHILPTTIDISTLKITLKKEQFPYFIQPHLDMTNLHIADQWVRIGNSFEKFNGTTQADDLILLVTTNNP